MQRNVYTYIVKDIIFRFFFFCCNVCRLLLNNTQSSVIRYFHYGTYFRVDFLHTSWKNHVHTYKHKYILWQGMESNMRVIKFFLQNIKHFSFSNTVTLHSCTVGYKHKSLLYDKIWVHFENRRSQYTKNRVVIRCWRLETVIAKQKLNIFKKLLILLLTNVPVVTSLCFCVKNIENIGVLSWAIFFFYHPIIVGLFEIYKFNTFTI